MPLIEDTSLIDLPLWLKIVGSVLTALGIVWAVMVAFIEPWADDRFMRRIVRCSDPIEKHLRDTVFKRDYEAIARRDEKIDRLQDEVRLAISSLTQQGKILADLPALSLTLTKMTDALASATRTLEKLESRVEEQGQKLGTIGGMIEAWRVPTQDNPLRPRKTRKASE